MKEFKPIRLSKYSGRNTFSDITNLGPTEFREITNFDLFSGMNGDYLRTRRGSSLIVPESNPAKLPDNILNKVVFPTVGGEFFIYNVEDTGEGVFYGQQEGENPFLIGSAIIEVGGDAEAFLENPVFSGLDPGVSYTISVITDTATAYIIEVYDGATLVAQAGANYADTPETVDLVEVASSGISGSFDVLTLVSGDLPITGTLTRLAFDVDDNVDPVDMEVYNDRVYVFSPNGNKIIYYDGGILYGRPMGLEKATIASVVEGGPGDMPANGQWYYGLEILIQKNGADLVASSPNRIAGNNEIATLITINPNSSGTLEIDQSILTNPYWTHIRLWRSKNATVDLSDPLSPIDAQGSPDFLYEVAIITRAEMLGALGPVDTGGELPPGNSGVDAGEAGGFYFIEDTNDDSVLLRGIGLDLIGLIPIPGCRTGTVNKGRIWAAGIGDDFIAPNGPLIDPVIREDWLYTTEQFSQYQEQWDPQAYLPAGRDGDRTESLLTLLEDVIGFRSSTTKRVASGNPASLVQMLDDKIGVPSFRCTGYIPGIGICAICSDGYFRYIGFDEQWHQYIGKTEISQSIYDLTAPVVADPKADFVYMNGKLLMLIPDGAIAALHVKEGKGWSLYDYPETFAVAFNFSNGERAAAAEGDRYLLEIEAAETKDADFDAVDADPIDITGSFEGFAFSGEGKLIQIDKYSFWGKLTSVPTITAKSSGQTWRVSSGFIDPGLFAANEALNEREYIFTPEPLDTTPFKWVPLRGQFITFSLSLVGPAMIAWQQVKGKISNLNGDLGVFPNGGFIPQGPGWGQFAYYTLNFEDPATTFYDASGKGQNYTWGGVGTKTNRVTQKPGKGLEMDGGGYVSRATDTACLDIGTRNMVFKVAFSLETTGSLIAYGRSGGFFYHLDVNTTRAVMTATNGVLKYSYTSTFAFAVGSVYILSFSLKSDLTGQFWYDIVGATAFADERTTVRAVSIMAAPSTGASILIDGIVSFYEVVKTAWGNDQAKRFWGEIKAY